jgi:hypothetical protein
LPDPGLGYTDSDSGTVVIRLLWMTVDVQCEAGVGQW